MDRRRHDPMLLAGLASAAVLHGGLLVAGSFRRTYDAYVHIFFADHYARDWFSTWEPRWYTGFTTSSYPPGSHQLIAGLSRLVGLELAFVVVQLGAVLLLVVGVHRFSRIWVGREAAGWAAIGAVLATSVAEAVHLFGQLPTTLSLALLLNALPFAHRWIVRGRPLDLLSGLVCIAATTGVHHVTTLFGSVFFLGPVVVHALVLRFRTPMADEPDGHPARVDRSTAVPLAARRLRRVVRPVGRTAVLGALTLTSLVIVVLPYWLWSSSDPISQVPIPHASRADFLTDRNAGLIFFVVPWGLSLLVLPVVAIRGLLGRTWPLAASILLLAVLGTGGTTPIPRLLLGGAFDILTLDRFTFWATIAILPFVGLTVVSLRHGRLRAWLDGQLGDRPARAVLTALAAAVVLACLWSANLASFRPTQPDPIDPAPIAAFLDKDQHDRWRYLTLGFGDQMAWLSANTGAQTVDGNYHSARRLPELTTTPVERLEGAKFRGIPGIGSLQQFLTVSGRYHLKYVFSNDRFYDPLLFASGWHSIGTLEGGIEIWEKADVAPLPEVTPSRELPGWQRLLWGLAPPTALLSALVVLGWHGAGRPGLRTAERADRATRRRGLLARTAAIVEHRLARRAELLPAGTRAPRRWHAWSIIDRRITDWRPSPASPGRRRLQAVAILLALTTVAGVVGARSRDAAEPTEVVAAYYDDLDVRRFTSAHDRLDPTSRPSFDDWMLQRSVENGLVASYSAIDTVDVRFLSRDRDRAEVAVTVRYVTALAAYEVTRTHELRQHAGTWYLVADRPDPTSPPDQFAARAGVDYVAQGRRQVTSETTSFVDVLDRPEVRVLEARLVRIDDRWAVVGRALNADVDPADVTVTAQLLDADGRILAAYDTGQATIHKVRPREAVPFRIDFEGVAGETDIDDPAAGDFRPEAASPLHLNPELLAGFDVYGRAVVTPHDLDTTLTVEDLSVVEDGDAGWRLTGSLRNDGVREATVPHVFLTLFDDAGDVAWVTDEYLPDAVPAQRSLAFDLPLPAPTEAVDTGLVPAVFDNGIIADAVPVTPPPPMLELPSATGWTAVDVQATSFQRGADE